MSPNSGNSARDKFIWSYLVVLFYYSGPFQSQINYRVLFRGLTTFDSSPVQEEFQVDLVLDLRRIKSEKNFQVGLFSTYFYVVLYVVEIRGWKIPNLADN